MDGAFPPAAADRPTATADAARQGVRTHHARNGRMTAADREELAQLLALHGIQPGGRHDIPAGDSGAHVLEIGFGMGDATIIAARAEPRTTIIAADVHTPGVLRLLRAIDAASLTNIRVVHGDALELMRMRIRPDSLAGIRIFFPDPWPKSRHRKRRLVQTAVIAELTSRLEPGGFLHLATDVADYADQMFSVVSSEPLLLNDYPGFAPDACGRPPTRFEERGRQAGRQAYDIVLHRVAPGS